MALHSSDHRNSLLQLVLNGIRLYVGAVPGPLTFISWRISLIHRKMPTYMNRGMSGMGAWSRGEAELFATFVSKLNQCHF